MKHLVPSALLRTALAVDAAASAMAGFVQIMYPYLVARRFGFPIELVIAASVLLGSYSVVLYLLTSSLTVASAAVWLTIAVNVGRGMVCLTVLGLPGTQLSRPGQSVLLVTLVAVIAFTAAQALGLRRSAMSARTPSAFAWRGTL